MRSAKAPAPPAAHSPAAIVRAFAAAWDRLDFANILALLAPGIRYENGPLPLLVGHGAVADYLQGAGPFDACRWDLISLAEDGTRVLTERIDHLWVRGTAIRLPVMGVFDVQQGLIHHWRDYFDLAAYRAQWPA
jgi:limonene-1,2-epoxide hydrolase